MGLAKKATSAAAAIKQRLLQGERGVARREGSDRSDASSREPSNEGTSASIAETRGHESESIPTSDLPLPPQSRDESPARPASSTAGAVAEDRKRWSGWTGDTAVHSDHQQSSSSEEKGVLAESSAASPPIAPLGSAATTPRNQFKTRSSMPAHSHDRSINASSSSSPGAAESFVVQQRRRSSLMTLELDSSVTDAEPAPTTITSPSLGVNSPPGKGMDVDEIDGRVESARQWDDAGEEEEAGQEDTEDDGKLDDLLFRTMQALEASNALLVSTLSSKRELARIRAVERAMNISMDQREAELHIRLQGNKQALEWMEKASTDLEDLVEQARRTNWSSASTGMIRAATAMNAPAADGSTGNPSGAMRLLRTMSEWPSASASMLLPSPQPAAAARSPSMTSPTISSHWRKPSYSGPLVSPSIGDAATLLGIVEAKDGNATIGKSAAKRLEKALKRNASTLSTNSENDAGEEESITAEGTTPAEDTTTAAGDATVSVSGTGARSGTQAPRPTSLTSPLAPSEAASSRPSSMSSMSSPSPRPMALPAMLVAPTTEPSSAILSSRKNPGHRRVSSQLIGGSANGRNASPVLMSLASTGITTGVGDVTLSAVSSPGLMASSGDASPWAARSPAASLSKARLSSIEALQQASGLAPSRAPSQIAPSDAGSESIPPSVAEDEEEGDEDDEDRDSIADSTTSGMASVSASGRRKRQSALSLKSPSLATKAGGHRSSASLSFTDGDSPDPLSLLSGAHLSAGQTANKDVSGRRDSRLDALAALQKLNSANGQPSTSPASPDLSHGWTSYVPSWLGGSNTPQSAPPGGRSKAEISEDEAEDALITGDGTISPKLARKLSTASSAAHKRASFASLGSLGGRSEMK